MSKYEVVESRIWKNRVTGATASIYGACPWVCDIEKPQWECISRGFTVRDNRSGTIGIGRKPWSSKSEAEAWVATH